MARKKPPHPALDLFGEVPVYTHDIDAWLIAVPKIPPGTRRAAWYVDAYNVPEKIRAAKLSGSFEQLIARRENSAWWNNRFSW